MESLARVLQRFGVGRLAVMIGVGAGAAALIAVILLNMGREPNALLYSNLDMREAGSITTQLEQSNVRYELRGDGTTILVPRDQVASTRLMLSGRGLPTSGSVGYEIFDSNNTLGQTDFVQQLNRQRALEGELSRTIRSLDGVTSARVHLVLPRRQLFENESEQPTASITIGVGGRQPSIEQVRAVQNLVSSAVPNLTPDRVTIIDQHGRTLSTAANGAAGAAEDRRNAVETELQRTVMNIVEGIVGAGRARVQVNADVDSSQVTTQQETYDPDGQVVRSEESGEDSQSETQNANNGAVSASTNVPGQAAPPAGAATAGNNTNRRTTTTNYEISRTTRTEVRAPGAIRRVSVAVAVDGVTAPAANGRPGAYTPRSAEEMRRIESLVKAAIGFSTDRNDQVTVVNVRFPSADAGTTGTSTTNPLMGFDKNDLMRIAELAVLAIVAGLILFFVVRPLIRGMGQPGAGTMMVTGPGGAGGMMSPDGRQVSVDPNTGQPLALAAPEGDPRLDIARIEGQVKASSVKRVSEFVDKHPEESVSILRSWLHETT